MAFDAKKRILPEHPVLTRTWRGQFRDDSHRESPKDSEKGLRLNPQSMQPKIIAVS